MVKHTQDYLVSKFFKNTPFPEKKTLELYHPNLDDYVYASLKIIYNDPFNYDVIKKVGECLNKKGSHHYLMQCWLLMALICKQSNEKLIRTYPNKLNNYWKQILKNENLI
jgi:hypothetical protein